MKKSNNIDNVLLSLNSNYKFGLNNVKRVCLSVMTLFCVAALVSCVFVAVSNVSPFVFAADVTVGNEVDLQSAIDTAGGLPLVIGILNDVVLTKELNVPAGELITLESSGGSFALIGASGMAVIDVYGKLTIDGIAVTHVGGVMGRGVTVFSGGELVLSTGKISNNQVGVDGGGVYIFGGGSFVMSGAGEVSENTATSWGGGVYVGVGGSFVLSGDGGVISENTARSGGGV
jgi:hypothetical protein